MIESIDDNHVGNEDDETGELNDLSVTEHDSETTQEEVDDAFENTSYI
jgi:hypothetical protein